VTGVQTCALPIYDPDGNVCATGASVDYDGCSSAEGAGPMELTRLSDGAVERWCMHLDGSGVEVTCPDGTELSVGAEVPGATTCMFGGDRACLAFTTPPPE
jgi:hypothetical protein